jgi:hypothetical protein
MPDVSARELRALDDQVRRLRENEFGDQARHDARAYCGANMQRAEGGEDGATSLASYERGWRGEPAGLHRGSGCLAARDGVRKRDQPRRLACTGFEVHRCCDTRDGPNQVRPARLGEATPRCLSRHT